MATRFSLILIALVITAGSCKKDTLQKVDCEKLKQGILADNKDQVRSEINSLINNLSSAANTPENLTALAQAISAQCDITATVLCFGCIYTLPSQSEIRLATSLSGTAVSRTVDISYDSENKMKFVSMHE